jgi:hypothetical protein
MSLLQAPESEQNILRWILEYAAVKKFTYIISGARTHTPLSLTQFDSLS